MQKVDRAHCRPRLRAGLVAAGVAAYVREDVSAKQAFPDSHAELPPGVPAFTESMSKAQLASAMDDAGLQPQGIHDETANA